MIKSGTALVVARVQVRIAAGKSRNFRKRDPLVSTHFGAALFNTKPCNRTATDVREWGLWSASPT